MISDDIKRLENNLVVASVEGRGYVGIVSDTVPYNTLLGFNGGLSGWFADYIMGELVTIKSSVIATRDLTRKEKHQFNIYLTQLRHAEDVTARFNLKTCFNWMICH